MRVARPKSVWSKTLSFDSTQFFKSLAKAAIKGVAGQWADAIAEAPEIAAAVGLEDPPQDRAWILIRRALARATLDLFQEYAMANVLDEIDPSRTAQSKFISGAQAIQFDLTPNLFRHPSAEVVPRIRSEFAAWLCELGIPKSRSNSLSERLDSYFTIAIHDEWRSNPKYYEPVADALESPFLGAAEDEMAWRRYAAQIAHMVDEPVFGESFSLRQIYIKPRGYFIRKLDDVPQNQRKDFSGLGKLGDVQAEVVDIMDELRHWVKSRDKENPLRILSGGPGSGKSSCAKLLAHILLSEDNIKTIFIPLHLINVQTDFQSAISEFLSGEGVFPTSPISPTALVDTTVLVLDGLDELEMQGRGAQEIAQQFVAEVARNLSIINSHKCRMLAIISGRELAVQSAEGNFRRPGQVIHLLPYFFSPHSLENRHDPKELLKEDQRDTWWRRYGELTGQNFESMPEALRYGELGEVTAQPLLNYLVALAFQRGDLQLSSATNINAVYDDLVKAVYERGWSRNEHPAVRGIPQSAFVRFLEEVALAVWHGRGRTTTLREIEDHCRQAGLGAMLPQFESGASSSVSALLLAFYFRQKGRNQEGDKTFEFTHKSFGEYLTALRLVRAIEIFARNADHAAVDFDHAWTDEEALARWLSLCGPTAMDRYLVPFVRREYVARGVEVARKAQTVLTRLYQAFLNSSWPMERFPQIRFAAQLRWARNAEEALFACLNACARVTGEIVRIQWPSPTSFGDALKRMQGQRPGPENALILDCLSDMDCTDCVLDMADLYKADLARSDLSRAMLHFVNLREANLAKTNMTQARLLSANLTRAELQGANFTNADLYGVLFEEEDASRPESSQADTRQKKFQRRIFRGEIGGIDALMFLLTRRRAIGQPTDGSHLVIGV